MRIDTHGDRFEVRARAEGGFEVRDRKAETPQALQLQPFAPVGRGETKHECNLLIAEYLRTGRFELPQWYTDREITVQYVDRAIEGRYGPGYRRERRSSSKLTAIREHEERAQLTHECTELVAEIRDQVAAINTRYKQPRK